MKAFKKIAAIAAAFMLLVPAPASLTVHAATDGSAFDETRIEDDLKGVDLSVYPKNEGGTHRLLDDVGFMEYGYSNNSFVSEGAYGIYFYVYNPTERALSDRPGAHVVNMSIAWNEEGLPTDYINLSLTFLDATDNNRFLKFKLTNGEGAYERAKQYNAIHGYRRYDFASLQIWFAGDRNATDSNVLQSAEDGHTYGASYICRGYAEGCASDPSAPSTLEVKFEELETVTLELEHTFYRTETSSAGAYHQNQIDTVYFSVPKQLFDKYGKLQRIKAEWYEYRTQPIVVTSNEEFYNAVFPYHGVDLKEKAKERGDSVEEQYPFFYSYYPRATKIGYALAAGKYEGDIFNEYISGWNLGNQVNGYVPFDSLCYIFGTKNWGPIENYDPYADDIEAQGGVSTSRLEDWIFNYTPGTADPNEENSTTIDSPKTIYENGRLPIKDGTIPAELFELTIDRNRLIDNERGKVTRGYSYYDFDADLDLQEWTSWNDSKPNFWDNSFNYGFWDTLLGKIPEETGRTVAPIQVLTKKSEEPNLENAPLSDELLIHASDVEEFKSFCDEAFTVNGKDDEEKYVVLFRFAVSDYESMPAEIIKFNVPNLSSFDQYIKDQAYVAQQEVFFDFDVIQLTFNNVGDMTVIPVVSSPIDIVNPITTPSNFTDDFDWGPVWWLIGTVVGLAAIFIVGSILEKKFNG